MLPTKLRCASEDEDEGVAVLGVSLGCCEVGFVCDWVGVADG
jgi:hypothetical protein